MYNPCMRTLWMTCFIVAASCSSVTAERHDPGMRSHDLLQKKIISTIDVNYTDKKSEASRARIIGGDRPSEEEYWRHSSFVVALVQEYKPGFFAQYCGGSLIDSRFVLTAAHCIASLKKSPLYAVLGRRILNDTSHGEIIPVQRSFLHPSYDPDSVLSKGDIAVCRLSYPVKNFAKKEDKKAKVDETIKPAKLITPALAPGVLKTGMATIFGYGRQEMGVSAPLTDDHIQASGSIILTRVDVPLVDNAWCNAEYELLTNQFEILPQQLCAGYEEGGRSSCHGDSGGPLLARSPADGEFYQIGLVSWAEGCASPHFPTVFTRVSSYLDFIKDKSTLVKTSLFQGEGAEDNLLFAGMLGNYVFCGIKRSSTLWMDFENLSSTRFVMTVGAFSRLELVGSFAVNEAPFQLPGDGSRHSMPLRYTADEAATDFATIRLNLVTAITPSKESFAIITAMALPPAVFEEAGKEEVWYSSEGRATWMRMVEDNTMGAHGKESHFMSGEVDNSEASCLLKYVKGSGTLTFDWRVSCEEDYDKAAVFVDNIARAAISGNIAMWESLQFEITDRSQSEEEGKGDEVEGQEHTITFCFFKDRSLSAGKDAAEVKNVKFSPASSSVSKRENQDIGTTPTFGKDIEDEGVNSKKLNRTKSSHLRRG